MKPKTAVPCVVCGRTIPQKRIEGLLFLETDPRDWTCLEHSLAKKVKGLFSGEVGTSELLIVDKLYNDSVRSMFKQADDEPDEPIEVEEKD